MSDIFFACPKCSNNHVADEAHCGIMVNCAECNFPLRVPLPVVRFQCSSCLTDLAAPRNIIGKIVQCGKCDSDVLIPAQVPTQTQPQPEPTEVKITPVEPKAEPIAEQGVKLPSLDEASRKRMIKNMMARTDQLQGQLKKAKEPKIIKFSKRAAQYGVVAFILWLLARFLINSDVATVVLICSIVISAGIFLLELVLFSGVTD